MTTTVTIELTDEQVAMLRGWGGALMSDRLPPETARSVVGAVIRKAYAALPPEPVALTIELPAGLAERISRHVLHVPPEPSVDLWRIVEKALRQAKEAGEPLP